MIASKQLGPDFKAMSRLSKNVLYNLLGQSLILVLGLVAVKYIFRRLGEDALGIIYFTTVMNTVIVAVLAMGISSTIIRQVAGYLELEPHYVEDLIRTFSFFYWAAYIIGGGAIFFLAPVIAEKWITLKIMDMSTATYVLRVLGIASLAALPRALYTSLLRGIQRMEFNNLIDVATSGLQQFGVVSILAFGGNLFHVVNWLAGCYFLSIFAYLAVCGWFFPMKALVPGYSSEAIRRNLGFASRMAFVSVTGAIRAQGEKLTISKLLPIGTLGYYSVVYTSISKCRLLARAVSQAVYPSLSHLFRLGNHTRLMFQYRKFQDLLCFGSVPIFAAILFASLPLFSYLLNRDIAGFLLVPTMLLSIGFYMATTLLVPHVFSLAVGKPEIGARQHFYDLLIIVPITVLLVYYLRIVGASLSLVFLYAFHYIYGVRRVCLECLRIPSWEWYLHVFRILLLAGLTYGVAWLVIKSAEAFSIACLISAYSLASVAFLIGAYFMIGNELRKSFLWHIRSDFLKRAKAE